MENSKGVQVMKADSENHLLYDDLHAAALDAGVPAHEFLTPDPELIEFLEQNTVPAGAYILDVGCGCGKNSVYLAQAGYIVTGIDASSNAITLAERVAKEKNCDITLSVLDATAEDASLDEQFDLVIDMHCLHVITRVERRLRFLRNLYAWLKPGGRYFGMNVGYENERASETLRQGKVPTDAETIGNGYVWEPFILETSDGPREYMIRSYSTTPMWPDSYRRELAAAGFSDITVAYSYNQSRRPCPHRLLASAGKV
jgi:SAM-dependent methyltransferase